MHDAEALDIAIAIEENRERMRRKARLSHTGWIDGHTGEVVPEVKPAMPDTDDAREGLA